MDIFYRCSFKSSNGYKMAKYDTASHFLCFIDENDSGDKKGMSDTICDTLYNELGRSMILASDEHGKLFLGIYKLIEGDYDKYVNVVFTDDDKGKIFQVFCLFRSKYCMANECLLNTVKRIPPDENGLEFSIDEKAMEYLLQEINIIEHNWNMRLREKMLYVFVTEDNCAAHLERLEQSCKLNIKTANFVEGIEQNQMYLDVDTPDQDKVRDSILLAVAAGIAAIIVIFLKNEISFAITTPFVFFL